jgi:hypothetical protein
MQPSIKRRPPPKKNGSRRETISAATPISSHYPFPIRVSRPHTLDELATYARALSAVLWRNRHREPGATMCRMKRGDFTSVTVHLHEHDPAHLLLRIALALSPDNRCAHADDALPSRIPCGDGTAFRRRIIGNCVAKAQQDKVAAAELREHARVIDRHREHVARRLGGMHGGRTPCDLETSELLDRFAKAAEQVEQDLKDEVRRRGRP